MAGYAKGVGGRVRELRESLGLLQAELAALLTVDRARISEWETEKVTPRIPQLRRLAGLTREPDRWYAYLLTAKERPGNSVYRPAGARSPGEPPSGGERTEGARGGHLAEIAADPDYQPEGSGFEPQISDDEVLDLLLFNRQGFTRYLMTRFEQPVRVPVAAKLSFLHFIEGLARERGITVPTDYLNRLRGLIQDGGL